MKLKDRVMVKADDPHYAKQRGYIVGDAEGEFGYDWDVMLDGHKVPVSFAKDQLVVVEVRSLDGRAFRTGNGHCFIGSVGGGIEANVRYHLKKLGIADGDWVGITIERVKEV